MPRLGVGIDEHRRRAHVGHGVGRGGEREGGHQHEITRADAEHEQREMQACGAARQRNRVFCAGHLRHLGLEPRQVGAGGGHPPRVDRVEHHLAFERTDVGRGQVDAGHGSSLADLDL